MSSGSFDLKSKLTKELPNLTTFVVSGYDDQDDLVFILRGSTNELVVSFNFDSTLRAATRFTCGTATFHELESVISILRGFVG